MLKQLNYFNTPAAPPPAPIYVKDGQRTYWIEENNPSLNKIMEKMRAQNAVVVETPTEEIINNQTI